MIAYHGTPCGAPRQEVARFLAGRHALIPFSWPADLGVALEVCKSVVLDNGAFSAWKKGGTIDVEGYFSWVDSVRHHPAFCWAVIPDVIDGSAEENDTLLARWPFNVWEGVPVWHLHETVERLRWLAGAWPTVALGSSGQWSRPGSDAWWERMSEAMDAICANGQPRCRLHGLRMLNPEVFTRLPLASADSTNVGQNANHVSRFGTYVPPTASQRMAVIADRVEAFQSAPCWRPLARQGNLFGTFEEDQ